MAKQKKPVNLAPSFITGVSGYGEPSGFQGSQYARTLRVGETAEEVMAQEQGALDTFGNILGRFAGRTALSVADTGAMLTAGLYTAISQGRISGLYDNSVSKKLEEVNKNLVEATPFYQTEEEKQAKIFSKDWTTAVTSSSFWGNTLGEGLGFVAGAALGGMGTGLALKGVGMGLRGLKTAVSASRIGTAMAAAAEESSAIKGLAEALKVGKVGEKVDNILKNRAIRDAAQFYTQKTVASMYEAGVEARAIKEELMNKKIAAFKATYGEHVEPSEAQLKEWEEQVDPYANVAFGLNAAVLQLDGIGVDKLFKGYSATRRAVNVARDGEKYIEPSKWRKALGYGKTIYGGMGKESLQEGLQYSIEKGVTGMLSDKEFGQRSLADWYQATIDGMSETFGSKEGQESIIIGALLGSKSTAVDAFKQSKLDKEGLTTLSDNLTSTRLDPLIKNINKEVTENRGNKIEDFAATSNKYLFRTAHDNDLYKLVKSRVDTGRVEDLYDDLRARKSMPVEEFNKMHGTDFTDAERHQTVDEIMQSAQKIAETIDRVESSYSKHPFKNGIVKLVSAISSYNKRISQIQGRLTSEDNVAEREILGSDLAFLLEDKKVAEKTLYDLLNYKRVNPEEAKNAGKKAAEEEKKEEEKKETPETTNVPPTDTTTTSSTEEDTSNKENEVVDETKDEVTEDDLRDPEDIVDDILNNRDRKGEVVRVNGTEVTIDGRKDDGIYVGSSETGKVLFSEEEIEREDSVNELPIDTPDESDHINTEVQEEEAPGPDAPDMSFMLDLNDPKGGHLNWSDFQLKDNDTFVKTLSESYLKKLTEEKRKEILENQKQSLAVKDAIINSLAELKQTHKLLAKNENGQLNVYALNNKTQEETLIGYFLNKNSKVQNTGGKKIVEFLSSYFGTPQGKQKLIPNANGKSLLKTIFNGWQKLIQMTTIKDVVDITPFVRMVSKIDNIGKGEKRTLFSDIVNNNKLSSRWKVNGEFLIIRNSNGEYRPIDGISREGTKLLLQAMESPNSVSALGTQYAILVKRPDSNAYQFIGLKGRELTAAEKKSYADAVKNFNNAPPNKKNISQGRELVDKLNNEIFLAYNEEVTLEDGNSYSTHLMFHLIERTGQIVTLRTPKRVNGQLQEGVSFKGHAWKGPKAIDAINNNATVRLTKTDKRTKDITFLTTQYLSTNVKPTLWDTRFRFDHDAYFEADVATTSNDFVPNEPPPLPVDPEEEISDDVEAQNIELAKSIYRQMKNGKQITEFTPKEQEIASKYLNEELRKAVDEQDSKGVRGRIKNIATEEEANQEDESNIADFKTAQDETDLVELNQDDVRNALKQITGLDVVFRTDLREKKGAFGVFYDGVIYLNSKVPKGTEWHEAFHAIFSILSKEEQDRVLRIAFNKWGVSREEALRLVQAYADRLNIDVLETKGKDWVIAKVLEEKIADHFQEFMVENKKPTILESFFQKLKRLVNWLFGAIEEPSFQSFFTKVAEGTYKDYKYDESRKTGEVLFKLVDGFRNEKDSHNFITSFVTIYKNRKDDRMLELYPEFEEADSSIDKIGPFVEYYMEILRKNAAKKVDQELDMFDAILQDPNVDPQQKRKAEEDFEEFNKTLEDDYYQDSAGRYIPKYLKPVNSKIIIDEIRRRKDLKIVEDEISEEDEKSEVYGKHEMETNQKIERASKAIRNAIDGLFFIDNGDIKILNGSKYLSNLLYNFSDVVNNIERIKDNGEEITLNAYEERLKELSARDTDFGKGVAEILKLFQTDASFRAQFYTAFDCRFVPAVIMVNNGKTRKRGNRIMNVNKKDHIYNQMNNWKNESFNSNVNKSAIQGVDDDDYRHVGEALGINIEDDTFLDPEAKDIFEDLKNAILFLRKDMSSYEFIKDSTITELLAALAEVNVKYSLNLQDLNFKNSKNKSMYSIMQNSFTLNELSKNGIEYAIFAGSKFSKYGSDNKFDYNDLDVRSFFLTTLGLYQNYKLEAGNITNYTPYFFIQQFESKSTNFVFKGKDYRRATDDEIMAELLVEKQRQDLNILKAIEDIKEKPIKNLIEGYHYFKGQTTEDVLDLLNKFNRGEYNKEKERYYTREDLPRGFQYSNLPNANTKPASADVVTIEDYKEMIDLQYENLREFMEETNINFGQDIFNEFNLGAGIDEEVYLREFLASQYLNRMKVVAILSPDLNLFKDFVDITKRGAGLLASGPSHYNPEGEENFAFAIFDDIMIDGAKSTDGQAVESISERIYRFTTLGLIAPTTSTINESNTDREEGYLALKAFENDDRETIAKLKDKSALLKVDKTVGYGQDYYMKTSVVPIVRYDTSEFAEEGETVTREVDGVMQEFKAFQDINNGRYYLPYPGKEKAWKLLNEMQINRGTEENPRYLKALFAKSAIKKGIRSVVSLGTDISNDDILEFSYRNYRLQQENPSGKKKIKDGSQLIQLIDAYFSEQINLKGDTLNVKNISTQMDGLIANLKQYGYEFFGEELRVVIDGEVYDPFLEYVTAAMQGSGVNDRVSEFFEVNPVTGEMNNSPNLPMIKIKYEEYILSYFNKHVSAHKVPGNKNTLVSSSLMEGKRIKETKVIDGVETEVERTLTQYEYDKLSKEDKKKVYSSRLKWVTKDAPYAEAIVSEEWLDQMGIDMEEWVRMKNSTNKADMEMFEKISTALAYRIPTQSQHSMVPIRIVDIVPRSYGSTIYLPAEITTISGADYDVDSVFIHRHAVYKKGEKLVSYTNDEASYKRSLLGNDIVKDVIKKIPSPERKELSVANKGLKKEIDEAVRTKAKIYNRYITKGKADKNKKDLQRFDMLTKQLNDKIEGLENAINENKKRMREINEEKFSEAIALINSGKETQISPTFIDESTTLIPETAYNTLLDLRLKLLTSEEGVKLINSPAVDLFEEVYNENKKKQNTGFFQKAGYPTNDSEKGKFLVYSGQDTMLNEFKKVSTGAKAIGGSANINKIAAFLQKNGIELSSAVLGELEKLYPSLTFSSADPNERDLEFKMDGNKITYHYEVTKNKKKVTITSTKLKSDLLSSLVSITVDNAKEQRLVQLHLTDKNISEASVLAMLGFGKNRLTAFLLSPIAKTISDKLNTSDTGISDFAEYKSNTEKIQEVINEMEKKGAEQVAISDDKLVASIQTYNDNKRIQKLIASEDYTKLSKKDKELVNLQYSMALLYRKVSEITTDAYEINRILNFNIKIGRKGIDIAKILGSFDKIKDEKFSFQGSNILKNIYCNKVRTISGKLENNISKRLYSYSENINRLTNALFYSTTYSNKDVKDSYPSKKFKQAVNDVFVEFLGIRLYFAKNAEEFERKFGINLYDENVINGKNILDAYNDAREELQVYSVAKLFQEYNYNTVNKPTDKYPFPRLGIDTFNNVSPDDEELIVSSFDAMMRSKDPKVANFRNNLMAHIAAHDNFKYTSGSVVGKLRSKYFSKINQVYKEDLKNIIFSREEDFNENFKNALGQEYYEVMREFIKFFFIDKRNRRKVKDLRDSLFSYKNNEDTSVQLDPIKISNTLYVVEVPSGVNFNKVMTPTVFNDGKDSSFIKTRVQFRVPSQEDPQQLVTSIAYEHIPTFDISPKVTLMQYNFADFFNLINKYREILATTQPEQAEGEEEYLSDDNEGFSSQSLDDERDNDESNQLVLVPDYMMDNILSMTSVQAINNELKRLTKEGYTFDDSQKETIRVKRDGLQAPKTATINIYSGDKNGFQKLSNFLNGPVTAIINGKEVTFKTVEHLYQTKKALFAGDSETAKKIYSASTGLNAQQASKDIKNLNQEAWDEVSSRELEDAMRLAFEQNESARNLLLSTGNATLTHKKANINLGKWEIEFPRILTEIREELQPEGFVLDKEQAQGDTPEEYTTNTETTSDDAAESGFFEGEPEGEFESEFTRMSDEEQEELRRQMNKGNLPSGKFVEFTQEDYRIQQLANELFSKIIDNFDDNYYQLSKSGEELGMNIESVQDIENMSFEDRMRLIDNICK